MEPNLLALVICVAVALVVAAMLFLLRDVSARRRAMQDREIEGGENLLDLGSLLPPTETAETKAERESWLGQLVAQTKSDFTAETAVLLAIFIGLVLGGTLLLWRDDWLAGAAGAIVGVFTVGGLLFFLRFRRHRAIREQLPDVMELMARAVRAGESLDQAIALAGNSLLRPVAAEFHYCASQMKMGLSLESAIRGLVRRAPLPETRILAMTLIVQRRRGGNLPTTLERLARVFRDRSNFYRQFQVATALGRGSAALIVLVALGLDVVVIFGQMEYAEVMLTSSVGRTMVAVALALQVVGVPWVLWLFRSEY